MKIVIFGSTGKTGLEVINQALDRGYDVVAYARTPGKIERKHERLTVLKGELDDLPEIEQAISGANAVISLLGPGSKPSATSLSEGVQAIISTMEKYKVPRIIQIATASAHDPNDGFDFKLNLTIKLLKLVMRSTYNEIVTISNAVKNSKLNWTLVRVPYLDDKSLTKELRVGYVGDKNVQHNLSRADLAWFMIEQIERADYVKKAPFISN